MHYRTANRSSSRRKSSKKKEKSETCEPPEPPIEPESWVQTYKKTLKKGFEQSLDCWGRFNPVKASEIYAVIRLVLACLYFIAILIVMTNFEAFVTTFHEDFQGFSPMAMDSITAYCVSTSIGSFIAIVTNGFAILGFKKREPSMVKPWLYTQIFVTMSTVFIGMVCDIIVHEKSTNAICFMDLTLGSHIVYSVWELYTWFVTKKALLEIMTPRAPAMMPNEDQNKIEEIEFTEQQEDLEKVEEGEKIV